MATLYEVNIPFSGLYESTWSHMLDNEEEQFVEYEESEGSTNENQPKELRLDGGEIWDILYYGAMDYSKCHSAIALAYVELFVCELENVFDFNFPTQFEYAGMDSPREYNFTTDRLFIKVNELTIKRFFTISRNDGHETLSGLIAERFTSRPGFCSFYDNELDEWLAKPLTEWDHNELGTLMLAAIAIKADDLELFEQEVENGVYDCSYEYFDAGLDGDKYQQGVNDLRNKKEDEQGEGYVAPYHCPNTLDLFNGDRA